MKEYFNKFMTKNKSVSARLLLNLLILILSFNLSSQVLFSEAFDENGTNGNSAEGIGWTINCPSCGGSSIVQSDGTQFVIQESNSPPATLISNNIDVSACSKLSFSMDYTASLPYPGNGNLESLDQCMGCSGNPLAQNAPCTACWDFIFVRLLLDGNPLYTNIIGLTQATAQNGIINIDTPCFIPGTYQNCVIEIYAQTITNDEIFFIDNVKLECITTTTPNITVLPSTTVCEGSTINFGISGAWSNPMWSGPNAFTSSLPNPSIANATVNASGTYTLLSTNAANCANIDEIDIIVLPSPQANFSGGDMLCQGECSDVDINISGGTPPFTINFSVQFGSLPPLPVNNIPISTFVDKITICYTTSTFPLPQWNAGTKTITIPANAAGTSGNFTLLSIKDANDCVGTLNGSVDFDFLLQPQATAFTLSECGDGSGQAIFDFNEAEPFIKGSESGTVTYFSDIALTNEVFSPFPSNGEKIYAVITNADGCVSIPVELTLEVKPPGDVGLVNLSCNPCNICDSDGVIGEDITINLNLPTNGSYNVELAYNIGGNVTNINESLLGPVGLINVNIDGDATFVVLSVKEGLDCPDNTGLGTPIVVTYNLKPDVQSIGLIKSCAPISLPPITVINPIGGGTTAYFTGPNATGTKYNPGQLISSNMVLYVYSGNPDCFDQEQVTINIGGLTTYAEPKDTAICGLYILPTISGTSVSGQAAYFTSAMGAGTKYIVGDTIKTSTTLFIFEPSNPACQTNNPDIIVTITSPPQIKLDSTVFACEQYKLPIITGTNLPGNQAYYSTPNFAGLKDSVGTLVIKTDTFYLYAGSATCFDKDTLFVKILKNTNYNAVQDINACNSYELPPILGTNVDTSAYYYTMPNGMGNLYKAGDLISSPLTLYIFDTLNKCQINSVQFNVTVAPGPEIFAINDTIVCETYSLPVIKGANLNNESYFTGPNGTGNKLAIGSILSNSTTLYAYESNAACATQKSFELTIEKNPKTGLGKVIGQCQENQNSFLNLFDLLTGPFDNNGVWKVSNGSFDITDPTKVPIPINTAPGNYKFNYSITPAVCAPGLTFSDFILVAQPNAGIDSVLTLCQGSPTSINLFSVLKNASATTGKFQSTFAIPDPTKLTVSTLNIGKYDLLYSLQNTNAASSTNCNDTAKITLNIISGSNAGNNAFKTVCKGATIELKDMVSGQTNLGIFTEKTTTGKLTGSIFNTSGLNPGFFTIYHIIPANGSCRADTSELQIEVKNLISAGNDIAKEYCSLKPIDLDSLIAIQNVGGSFVFSGFGGVLDNNSVFTPSLPATFEIKYKVGDGVICPTDEASVTLTFIQNPVITLSALPTICLGESMLLQLNGNGGFDMDVILQTEAQYNSGNLNANLKNIDIVNLTGQKEITLDAGTFKPNTKYYVTVKTAKLGACSYDVNLLKQFTVLESPTKQVNGNYCVGDEITIAGVKFNSNKTKDTLLVNNSVGCDSVLYVNLAFNNNTTSDYTFLTCKSDYKYVVNGKIFDVTNPSGSVLLNIKNAKGCDSTVNVKLTFDKPLLTLKTLDAPCEDGTGILTIENATLLKGSPILYINNVKTDSIITYPKELLLSPGNYTIELIDRDDCKTSNDIDINVSDEPIVTIKETTLSDGTKQLSYQSSLPLVSFTWSPIGLVNCADCPLTNVLDYGDITLNYTYGDNCEGSVTYKVIKEVIKEIYFPTIINLNSESGNNLFYPKKPLDYNVVAVSMAIYDRWGNLVWQRKNFEIGVPENGWNGSFNGKELNSGVYVYTLSTLDEDNIAKTYVGDVTIIK